MVQTLRIACLAMFVAVALIVLDAPLRTFGQKYEQNRLRERLVLLSFEADFVLLWALAIFYFRWDPALLPRAWEPTLTPLGTLVTAAGTVLCVWARLRLGRWFTGSLGVKVGHELVTDGPYAVTRHPMYTGLVLAIVGAALAWDSLLTLILAALLVLPFFVQTVYEESLFEKHFGAAYHEYQARVPRLVPFARWGKERA